MRKEYSRAGCEALNTFTLPLSRGQVECQAHHTAHTGKMGLLSNFSNMIQIKFNSLLENMLLEFSVYLVSFDILTSPRPSPNVSGSG